MGTILVCIILLAADISLIRYISQRTCEKARIEQARRKKYQDYLKRQHDIALETWNDALSGKFDLNYLDPTYGEGLFRVCEEARRRIREEGMNVIEDALDAIPFHRTSYR